MTRRRGGFPRGSRARDVAVGLAALRIVVGAGALAATRPALRLLGFGEVSQPATTALARLAGSRDVAMGVLALASRRDPRTLRTATLVNAAVDAADAAAFTVLLVRRQGLDRAAVLGVPTALAASGTGVWVAARRR